MLARHGGSDSGHRGGMASYALESPTKAQQVAFQHAITFQCPLDEVTTCMTSVRTVTSKAKACRPSTPHVQVAR